MHEPPTFFLELSSGPPCPTLRSTLMRGVCDSNDKERISLSGSTSFSIDHCSIKIERCRGGLFPGEPVRMFNACRGTLFPLSVILKQRCYAARQFPEVFGRNATRQTPKSFNDARHIARHNGRAAGHGFLSRQTKTFIERWINNHSARGPQST